jgi:hypothetical protein
MSLSRRRALWTMQRKTSKSVTCFSDDEEEDGNAETDSDSDALVLESAAETIAEGELTLYRRTTGLDYYLLEEDEKGNKIKCPRTRSAGGRRRRT